MLPFLILGGIVAAVAAVAASDSDTSGSSGNGSSSGGASAANERRRLAQEEVRRYVKGKLGALMERERVPMSNTELDALVERFCIDAAGANSEAALTVARRCAFGRETDKELAALTKELVRLKSARAVLETIGETV